MRKFKVGMVMQSTKRGVMYQDISYGSNASYAADHIYH